MAISVNNEGTLKELGVATSPIISGIDYISEPINPASYGKWITFPRDITSYLMWIGTMCDTYGLTRTSAYSNAAFVADQITIQTIYNRFDSYPNKKVGIGPDDRVQVQMEYGDTSKTWFGESIASAVRSSITILGLY